MGVEPPTSTESSWESNLLLLQKAVGSRHLSLLQKAVGSRPSHFYRKQLGVDPLTSTESSWESTLSLLQKAVGSRPPTSTESSWESTLSLRQKVVGSRPPHFYRKQLVVYPHTSTEKLGVDTPTLQKGSRHPTSTESSWESTLTTESSWESTLLLLQKAVGSRHSYFYRK